MTQVEDTVRELRADLVCECLGGIVWQAHWIDHFLAQRRYPEAIAGFERLLTFCRSAAEEMKHIRAAEEQAKAMGEMAQDYRDHRPAPKAAKEAA